jgi:hypothetical protein
MINKLLISEAISNIKARQFVLSGQLSQEDFDKIKKIAPKKDQKGRRDDDTSGESLPDPKYVNWIAHQWVKNGDTIKSIADQERIDPWSLIQNKVEEYIGILRLGNSNAISSDIFTFENFEDFKNQIDEINNTSKGTSSRAKEREYDILADNNDLVIVHPRSHPASRKSALKYFAHRTCSDGAGKDSAWCTTYKDDSQWVAKYHAEDQTIYYCGIKSDELMNELKKIVPSSGDMLVALAVLVARDGTYTGIWDAADSYIGNQDEIKKIISLLNSYSKR